MILEPTTVLILRCDRCNTPHLDAEYEVPCRWDSREQIEEAFKSDPGDGWQKVGDQFLCEPCVPVGAVPLSAIDEAVVRRERASYTASEGECGAVSEHGDVCARETHDSGMCRSGVGRLHVSSPGQAGKPWFWFRSAAAVPGADAPEESTR